MGLFEVLDQKYYYNTRPWLWNCLTFMYTLLLILCHISIYHIFYLRSNSLTGNKIFTFVWGKWHTYLNPVSLLRPSSCCTPIWAECTIDLERSLLGLYIWHAQGASSCSWACNSWRKWDMLGGLGTVPGSGLSVIVDGGCWFGRVGHRFAWVAKTENREARLLQGSGM